MHRDKIFIEPRLVKAEAVEINSLLKKIDDAYDEVRYVRSAVRSSILREKNLRGRLNDAKSDIRDVERAIKDLYQVLDYAAENYQRCDDEIERRTVDNDLENKRVNYIKTGGKAVSHWYKDTVVGQERSEILANGFITGAKTVGILGTSLARNWLLGEDFVHVLGKRAVPSDKASGKTWFDNLANAIENTTKSAIEYKDRIRDYYESGGLYADLTDIYKGSALILEKAVGQATRVVGEVVATTENIVTTTRQAVDHAIMNNLEQFTSFYEKHQELFEKAGFISPVAGGFNYIAENITSNFNERNADQSAGALLLEMMFDLSAPIVELGGDVAKALGAAGKHVPFLGEAITIISRTYQNYHEFGGFSKEMWIETASESAVAITMNWGIKLLVAGGLILTVGTGGTAAIAIGGIAAFVIMETGNEIALAVTDDEADMVELISDGFIYPKEMSEEDKEFFYLMTNDGTVVPDYAQSNFIINNGYAINNETGTKQKIISDTAVVATHVENQWSQPVIMPCIA